MGTRHLAEQLRQDLAFQLFGGVPISPIPEPTTWTLMIAGFGLLGVGVGRSVRRETVTA